MPLNFLEDASQPPSHSNMSSNSAFAGHNNGTQVGVNYGNINAQSGPNTGTFKLQMIPEKSD